MIRELAQLETLASHLLRQDLTGETRRAGERLRAMTALLLRIPPKLVSAGDLELVGHEVEQLLAPTAPMLRPLAHALLDRARAALHAAH